MNTTKAYTLVGAMALMGGLLTALMLYVGGAFAHPEIIEVVKVVTMPAPGVTVEYAPTITPEPMLPPPPVLRARLSHYFPAWGPPNCHPSTWDGVTCSSFLSDGRTMEHWSYWENIGLACPAHFDIGTKFKIEGFGSGVWSCVDRGGAIELLPDGTFFLDLLTRAQPYVRPAEAVTVYDDYSPYGSYIVEVTILD